MYPDSKERSLLEERSFPTKCEEQLICLFLKDRFNIKINVRDVPTFINFNNVAKTDLLDVIYNYFFMFKKKIVKDEVKFIFNDREVRNFFNFGKMSK